MYEPCKHLATFFVSGFQHHDGALVLDQLKPGMELNIVPENDPWKQVRVGLYVTDNR